MRLILTFFGLLIFMFSIGSNSFGQSFDTLWTKTYWNGNFDSLNCIQETSDGGFIMTGCTQAAGVYQSDVNLIKTDSEGNVEWSNTIGDDNDEAGFHVLQANDGGYLVSAHSSGFTADPGATKVWIIKTDSEGDTTWTYPITTYRTDGFPISAIQTFDSGYAITGRINISYDWKAFILRLDKDGGLDWFETYGSPSVRDGWFIAELPDSDLVLAGHDDNTSGGTLTDYWACRTDREGIKLWDSTYALTEHYDEMHGACIHNNGLVMVGEGGGAGQALKIDLDGNTVWSKSISIKATNEEYNSVCQTADGGLMVGGWLGITGKRRDFCYQKMDAFGDTVWTYTVGGFNDDHGRCVVQTSDGGYAQAGLSSSWVNGTCFWLAKIDDITTDMMTINSDIVPNKFTLSQNYPNPFNPTTVIQFNLPRLSKVEIEVYNILGQTVRNLVDEEKPAGKYRVTWDGRDNSGITVSSGMYFYKIKTDDFSSSKKMLLLK